MSAPQLKLIDNRREDNSSGPFIPLGVGPQVRPPWVTGTVKTGVSVAYRVSADITGTDIWEHFKCRAAAFRDHYTVSPGLYAAGNPDGGSDVLVSANYKLSFDHL